MNDLIAKSKEAEEILISTLLFKPNRKLYCTCSQDDFVSGKLRAIFLALKPADKADYREISNDSGISIGDIAQISSNNIPTSIKTISEEVSNLARKRRLLEGMDVISRADYRDSNDMLSGVLALYRSEQSNGDKDCSTGAALSRFGAIQQKNRDRGSMGRRTGFKFLDDNYIQLVPGHMWVIGALPGTGKTNTLIQFIANLDCRCLVFSTEMTEAQLMARYFANKTGIDSKVILSGSMLDMHHRKVEHEKEIFRKKKIKIIDNVRYLEDIERITRLENMRDSVEVVFLDYLQHVKTRAGKGKYEAASDISHTIQEIGKDCDLTTVNFSQVTITSHKEYTGNAQFKGAGDFAEDCDLGARLMSNPDMPGTIKWTTEKNRHGVRPEQLLAYKDNYTRLEEVPQ